MPESALTMLADLRTASRRPRHVGVLVPWANVAVETELPRLGREAVVWHYARLAPSDASTALDDTFLDGLLAAVPAAIHQLSRLQLEATLLACTSAGFSREPAGQAKRPVMSDAFCAVVSSLRQLQAGRVVLLTPYPTELTVREALAFGTQGIEVLDHASLDQADDYAAIKAASIRGLFDDIEPDMLRAADAIVLSCTGWPTLPLLAELEARYRRPVVSSNLAMTIAVLS